MFKSFHFLSLFLRLISVLGPVARMPASATVLVPALALALVFALAAPISARAQTVIEGNHLENTKVGFYGFRLDIPHNYTHYTDVIPADVTRISRAENARRVAVNFDRKSAWANTLEVVSFGAPTRGLSLAVIRLTEEVPPLKKEKEYQRTLDFITSWGFARAEGIVVRDQRKIGDILVGRVARVEGELMSAIYVVLVPPRTCLTFIGSGLTADKDAVLADLDAAIATLEIGKKKR